MNLQIGTLTICLIAAVAVISAQSPQPVSSLADRLIGQDHGQDITAGVPFARNAYLEDVALRMARSVRIPADVERVADNRLRDSAASDSPQTRVLRLTGQKLSDALQQLVAPPVGDRGSPGIQYVSSIPDQKGVIHVTAFRGRATFLDRRVARFEVNGETLGQLLPRLHRLEDPEFPREVGTMGSITSGQTASGQIAGEFSDRYVARPVRASLTDVSLRDVLDRVVTEHGSASWIVRYASLDGTYAGSEISFATFDGRQLSLHSRRR